MTETHAIRLTSIVCHGELLALARKRRWGDAKLMRVRSVLDAIQAVPVASQDLLRAYADMDAWSEGKQAGPGGEPPVSPSRTMGKNDLWVAATAHLAKATLLTTDRKDFEPMGGIWFDLTVVEYG